MGIEAQFASHLRVARDIYMAGVEANALRRAERGTIELIFHHGQPSWKLDHRYEGWSDEDLRDLGLSNENRYQHRTDGDHGRIQNSILHAPPVELVSKALQAYSRRWASQQHIEVDQRATLGVTILGDAKPKAIDVTPKPLQVEHVGRPTEVSGVFEEVVKPKLSNDLVATSDHPEHQNRTGEALSEPKSDGVDHSPDNPVRVALLDQMESRRIRLEAEASKRHGPAVAPPTPPEMKSDVDRDLPDDGSTAPKPAPPPSMDKVGEQIYEVKRLLHSNLPMSAIQRQVAAALNRGSTDDARKLLGFKPTNDREGIGRGNVPAGGAELTTGRIGGSQKMV
jgi:hypothetical protein